MNNLNNTASSITSLNTKGQNNNYYDSLLMASTFSNMADTP